MTKTKVVRGKTPPWHVRSETWPLHDGSALLKAAIKTREIVLPWEKEQVKSVKGFFRNVSADQKDGLPERIARISVADLGCRPTMPGGENYELREILHRADIRYLKLCSDFAPLEICFGRGFLRAKRGESLTILTKSRKVNGVLFLIRVALPKVLNKPDQEKRVLHLSAVEGYGTTLFGPKDEFLMSVV